MKRKTYVSERVVNISKLESYIEKAHLSLLLLIKGLEDGRITNILEIKDELLKADADLERANNFEFCVERRKTII